MKDREINIDRLQELISFDEETGLFTWKPRGREFFSDERSHTTWNAKHAHKPALCTVHSAGYLCGRIEWTLFKAHRVAFALSRGRWPKGDVDHINQNKMDNRPDNLREVSNQQNAMNRKLPVNNSSGAIGVGYHSGKGKWFARIKINQKLIHLGHFETFEQAKEARQDANERLGFSALHGS